jgi:hypothetical protein
VVSAKRKATVKADAAVRAMKAWTARVTGSTWEEAEIAGFTNPANALRAVKNYFGSLPDIEREDQRALWRARLEHLWAQALVDVQQQRPGAVRAAVAVGQRSAQLDGLDAP